MEKSEPHDAVPVRLADAWVGVCATCDWIGPERESEQRAAADDYWHMMSSVQVEAETVS
jgi:hypothetical protein